MSRTILIVDDEKSVLEFLSRLFRLKGFEVLSAESVEEARKLISECDLVLSDIRIGGDNGIEFLEELRSQGFDKSALLMSGMMIEAESERAIELTGHSVIPKPTNFKEVLEIVERIIARRKESEKAI